MKIIHLNVLLMLYLIQEKNSPAGLTAIFHAATNAAFKGAAMENNLASFPLDMACSNELVTL